MLQSLLPDTLTFPTDPATYPNFNIYKPVAHPFPAENTQPILVGNEKQISLSSTLGSKSSSYVGLGYPILNICQFPRARRVSTDLPFLDPVAYPYFDLYPRPACSPTITSDMEGLLLDSVNTSRSTSSESLLHARYEYPVLIICKSSVPDCLKRFSADRLCRRSRCLPAF